MKAEDIRKIIEPGKVRDMQLLLLEEIAAQLAEINQRLADRNSGVAFCGICGANHSESRTCTGEPR